MTGYLGRFARELGRTLAENHRRIGSTLEPATIYDGTAPPGTQENSGDYMPVGSRIAAGAATAGYAILYTASQTVMTLWKTPRMIINSMEE